MALLAALLAGTVSGLTGFGLALVSTPLLLFVYEPKTVMILTTIFSIFISAAVVYDSWREARQGLALALLIPRLFGVVLGTEVLRLVNPDYIRLAVGVVVVLLRIAPGPGSPASGGRYALGTAGRRLDQRGPLDLDGARRTPDSPAPRLPRPAQDEFRSTSALYFLAMSLVGLLVLSLRGLIEGPDVTLSAILVPFAIVGKVIGTAFLKRSPKGPSAR